MKAVIETGGKQYYVELGQEIYVEKLDNEAGKHGRQKKVVVFKYKQKNNYHKKQGHRQPYTKVKITSIEER